MSRLLYHEWRVFFTQKPWPNASLCSHAFHLHSALFASLLSLPAPDDSPPPPLSPQRQKQKTQEALVAWFLEEAEQRAVYAIWEDLHWADSSTLEVLRGAFGHSYASRSRR